MRRLLTKQSHSIGCCNRTAVRLMRYVGFLAIAVLLFIMMPTASALMHEADTLRKALEKFLTTTSQKPDLNALQRFYSGRNYQPVWLESDSVSDLHAFALEFIANAEAEGLDSRDYQLSLLWKLRADPSTASSFELEFRTTQALLLLSEDLRRGQLTANDVDPDWHISRQPFDSVSFLLNAVASDNLPRALHDLPPQIPSYQLLRQALAKYRDLESRQVVWTRIPVVSAVYPYTSHEIIPLLRARITEAYQTHGKVEYNLPQTLSEYYDEALVHAIKAFQAQHGLNADGIIGKNTQRALNMTPADKIRQLRLNMERLRWLPRELGDRYVLVNIAGFQLAAVKDAQQRLNMRIIVGKNYRSTPSFSSHISHMVLNPYWNIPASIAREDLLPKQQKNPAYFTSQGIKIYPGYDYQVEPLDPNSIDWPAIEKGFPYVLRQDPGVKNALGKIKFMLPNPFSIYLHDTPSKSLFHREIRAFSSGCIRLEQPLELADFAMEGYRTLADLAAQIDTNRTVTVNLPELLPVYIVYLTTWIDSEHKIHYSPDTYGRDARALNFARW